MSSVSRAARRPFFRTVALVTAVAGAVVASACSGDAITQPSLSSRQGTTLSTAQLTALVSATGLTRDVAIPLSVVRSFTFTQNKGGTMDLSKEAGLKIEVPQGAIPTSTLTITVTVLPGTMVAYDFQPHGTVFLKPLVFRQDLNNTSWDNLGFKGVLEGGYFKSTSQIDPLHGTARLDELFPVTLGSSQVSFKIKHFSGYMVSTGRSSDEESLF